MAITMKQARVGLNLSQTEMAEKMDCSAYKYRKWEKHPDSMPVKDAQKFCEIVKLSYDDILFA